MWDKIKYNKVEEAWAADNEVRGRVERGGGQEGEGGWKECGGWDE